MASGSAPKIDAKAHSVVVSAPLEPGKVYFLWAAAYSGILGTAISLVTQYPLIIKLPDPVIAAVKVISADGYGVSIQYQITSYLPEKGKIFYAVSREGVDLTPSDVEVIFYFFCIENTDVVLNWTFINWA